ncbi:hypothetical protein EVAR_8714_1 [Eumeta japonica]|uniref:Uncharacterized protein n=1 Tax=Eumeta variegata TaxID=151549 RepID=A0A4C1XN88_EUMVA|nr:hypothetical protein EVAR_8714_1 [Eumeta japonica]
MNNIIKAVKRMKVRKADEYNRVSSEILKDGRGIVTSLIYQLLNKSRKFMEYLMSGVKQSLYASIKQNVHSRERCDLKEDVVTKVGKGMLDYLYGRTPPETAKHTPHSAAISGPAINSQIYNIKLRRDSSSGRAARILISGLRGIENLGLAHRRDGAGPARCLRIITPRKPTRPEYLIPSGTVRF